MTMYSRKDFMKMLGLNTAALSFARWNMVGSPYHPSLGLQLYTIRKEIEKDFDGTIRRVADIGYCGIETYALPAHIVLGDAAKVFRESGLNVTSMHIDFPDERHRENILRLADAYRCENAIFAGWPEGDKYQTIEAMKRTTNLYNEAASFLKAKGVRFGLHNHWWEFEKKDGIEPFYYLLEHLDREIFFEIDAYWAKTGGRDPAKVIKDFGKRAPFVHVKDGPAVKVYQQVPIGKGTMDYTSVADAGGQHIQWFIVEFDEYAGDIFEGIQTSYTYLTAKELAQGKI
jgi:sugar phosphate isomerase/epimerase